MTWRWPTSQMKFPDALLTSISPTRSKTASCISITGCNPAWSNAAMLWILCGRLAWRCSADVAHVGNPTHQRVAQFLQPYGLADVVVHACRQAPLAIAGHGVGGQRANGLVAAFPFAAADHRGGLEAVH